MKNWLISVMALWLVGCMSSASATPTAPSASAAPTAPSVSATPAASKAEEARVKVSEVSAQLTAAFARLPKPTAPTGILWSAAYTPLFPSEWPPTAQTVWTRYAYALGREPSLADGVRISALWARVAYRVGASEATIVNLRNTLDAVDTQGVRPLDAQTAATLRQEQVVFDACLKLNALPTGTEADLIRAYYKAWLRFNGAIVAQVKPHAAFVAWVQQ